MLPTLIKTTSHVSSQIIVHDTVFFVEFPTSSHINSKITVIIKGISPLKRLFGGLGKGAALSIA